jgi:uncharacterized protein YjbI with pentapeptide repeats
MDKIIPDVKTLKESFYIVKIKSTLIERECALLKEANRFDIPLAKYEKLFELYEKDKIDDSIIAYPKINIENWGSNLILWKDWLDRQNKARLFKEIFNFLLEKGAILSVLLSATHYIITSPERENQLATQKRLAHYQDWNIINSSIGKESANGARFEALQSLNTDKVNMYGINLEGALLLYIDLRDSKLSAANFKSANLYKAKFNNADLRGAYFDKAANSIKSANLNDASFYRATLSGVKFTSAYLKNTDFRNAKLDAAVFYEANLKDANLKNAELCGTTFNDYPCADFRGVKNLTVKQIKSAIDWEKADYDSAMRLQLGL